MATNDRLPNVTLEGVEIIFPNFSGKEGRFNKAGDRNFKIKLDPETAEAMAADGWNINQLKPREGYEDQPIQDILQVKVKYSPKARPPRIILVTSRGRQSLGEEEINILDWARIINTDLIIRPYAYDVNGKTGISAYVQSLYITIEEDELEQKYADVPDSGRNAMIVDQHGDDGPPW